MNGLTLNNTSRILKIPAIHLFHTCSSNYGQANVMRKLLKGAIRKKRVYCDAPVLPTPEEFSKGAFDGKKSINSRRSAVLNKLFMRHITDLMATGENSNIYAGLGIEINKVRITPDYKLVQVYWACKNSVDDEVIDKLLTKNAGQLRHELTQLRVIGVVPKISFFKDKALATIAEIDIRLAKADFGEDHVPVNLVSKLKSELELSSPLEPHIKEKISMVDKKSLENIPSVAIPVMPQHVFGINHADIMFRVIQGVKKAQAVHRKEDVDGNVSLKHSANLYPLQFDQGVTQKQALKKFLLQRQVQRSKARKENKNYSADMEYMRHELEESHNNMVSEFLERNTEEKDYIDEFDDDYSYTK